MPPAASEKTTEPESTTPSDSTAGVEKKDETKDADTGKNAASLNERNVPVTHWAVPGLHFACGITPLEPSPWQAARGDPNPSPG